MDADDLRRRWDAEWVRRINDFRQRRAALEALILRAIEAESQEGARNGE